jgi:hypothetical protein
MTIEQAKALKYGDMVHHISKKNADGTPMRAKVLSIKTWKRNPSRILLSVKRGMYEFAKFNERELEELQVGDGLS